MCLHRQVHDLLESPVLHSFLNGWICCSRAASRSACSLLEFVQSGFRSSVCSLPLGVVRISLRPGRRLISRTLHWSRTPNRPGWLVFKLHGAGLVPVESRSFVAALRRARVPLGETTDSGVASQLEHRRSCHALDQWDVDGLLHSSFRNPLLRNHLDCFRSLFHRNMWHCTALAWPPRSTGPSVSPAAVVASELFGLLAFGVASQLLRLRSRQCAALSGPCGHGLAEQRACHPPRSSARSNHTPIRAT